MRDRMPRRDITFTRWPSAHMTRGTLVGIALVLTAGATGIPARATLARCSYVARYPAATGRHTFVMATATAATVPAVARSAFGRLDTVAAQVMRVDQVAGHQSDLVARALQTTRRTAVFVRHRIGATCASYAPRDGAPDSVGTTGLYVGAPRPASEWIGGRPTFDVFRADHFPLPQRLHGRAALPPSRQQSSMTASELLTLYRALWSEVAIPRDTSPGRRIRAWIASNPRAARKVPAEEVARGALYATVEADAERHSVPLGGTYAITFTLAGVDSTVLYARTWRTPQVATTHWTTDSASGVPTEVRPTSFMVVMTMAPSRSSFPESQSRGHICGHLPIVVQSLPVTLGADSSWSGELPPAHLSACGASTPPLRQWTDTVNKAALGDLRVTFRRHRDGRVTFEGRGQGPHQRGLLVRGRRISTVQDVPRVHDEPGR